MTGSDIRLALTCDDAPTIGALPGFPPDASRLDRLREALQEHRVPCCVAFVIGATAEAHPEPLQRWLEAGYELGNHSWDHRAASAAGPDEAVASFGRCDRLLADLGAFEGGRRRWLRFPYLDRGRTADERVRIHSGIEALGYSLAPASTDLFDHRFEGVLAEALSSGDAGRARRIESRYRALVGKTIRSAQQRLDIATPRARAAQVPYLHLGLVWDRGARTLLADLVGRGTTWCTLASALEHPVYADYVADAARSGLVPDSLPRPLFDRCRRSLLRRLPFREAASRRLGPRWPHLS